MNKSFIFFLTLIQLLICTTQLQAVELIDSRLIYRRVAALSAELPNGALNEELIQTKSTKLLFHWTTERKIRKYTKSFFDFFSSAQDKELTDEKVLDYLKSTTEYKVNESLWNGLYLAMNPIVSQRYGADGKDISSTEGDWILVVIKVPAKTKFINASTTTPLSHEERNWFLNFNCGLVTKAEELDNRLVSGSSGCAKGLTTYLDRVDAQGVVYNWWELYVPACTAHDNSFNSKRAIILKRPDILTLDNISFFTRKTKSSTENIELMKLVQDFWQQDHFSNYTGNIAPALWDIQNDGELSIGESNKFMDCTPPKYQRP